MWIPRMTLPVAVISICALLGVATGNEGPAASLQQKSPVYFPILPEDFKDFGIKIEGGSFHSRGDRTGKKLDMPVTTAKPTTTTDKLPINPGGVLSHVAQEAITEPPGPSYLTDSYYYLDDHTHSPGSDEHSDEGHGHDHGDISEIIALIDRESENFGAQALQNLATVSRQSYGVREPSTLALSSHSEPPEAPSRPSNRVPARYTTPAPVPTTAKTTTTTTTTTPAPTTTRAPTTRASPTPAAPSSIPNKNVKLRPAYTPIPTLAPTTISTAPPPPNSYKRPSTRNPNRISSKSPARISLPSTTTTTTTTTAAPPPPKQTYGRPERLSSRRPQAFESSRLSKTTSSRSSSPSRRPTAAPKSTYRTPTPPTVSTTAPAAPTTTRAAIPSPSASASARSFGDRASQGSAPRRQYLTAVTNTPSDSPVYRTSTKAYRAPSSLYHNRGATTTVTAPSQPDFVQSDANIYVPLEYDEEAIPGEAGLDYPNFRNIPETSFTCSAQEHPGLYADTESRCQTFHICQEDGRQDSFLCPNGTIFNQQYFVCDWWYNFSCDHADRFYSLNAFIYEIPESTKYERK